MDLQCQRWHVNTSPQITRHSSKTLSGRFSLLQRKDINVPSSNGLTDDPSTKSLTRMHFIRDYTLFYRCCKSHRHPSLSYVLIHFDHTTPMRTSSTKDAEPKYIADPITLCSDHCNANCSRHCQALVWTSVAKTVSATTMSPARQLVKRIALDLDTEIVCSGGRFVECL